MVGCIWLGVTVFFWPDWLLLLKLSHYRSGVGAPVIGDLDGEYRHDSRRNILEWCLPVIDVKNKTGSLEFSIPGQPNDFFPVNVSFVSKGSYCDIQVKAYFMDCKNNVLVCK